MGAHEPHELLVHAEQRELLQVIVGQQGVALVHDNPRAAEDALDEGLGVERTCHGFGLGLVSFTFFMNKSVITYIGGRGQGAGDIVFQPVRTLERCVLI